MRSATFPASTGSVRSAAGAEVPGICRVREICRYSPRRKFSLFLSIDSAREGQRADRLRIKKVKKAVQPVMKTGALLFLCANDSNCGGRTGFPIPPEDFRSTEDFQAAGDFRSRLETFRQPEIPDPA
jgi:hypothetical protein